MFELTTKHAVVAIFSVITGLFIMRIVLIFCAEKLLVPTIFFNLYTIKLWFQQSLRGERFKSGMDFWYQSIVSEIKFRFFCEVYDTDSLVYEVSELTVFCKC